MVLCYLWMFSRWVNPVKRPIRTSWTSKVLNVLSSCLQGQHSLLITDCNVRFCTTWDLNPRICCIQLKFRCFFCALQLGYRERRVAGSHRQGHRRLHKEENNLHIQSESGGGKTTNLCGRVSTVFRIKHPHASVLTFRLSQTRRRALLTAGLRWVRRLPSGSQTWGPPCAWSAPASSPSPGGGITVAPVERSAQLWPPTTLTACRLCRLLLIAVTCVCDRWCVRLVLPISTTWSTWRTNQLVCVITALPSCRRTVSNQDFRCSGDLINQMQHLMIFG